MHLSEMLAFRATERKPRVNGRTGGLPRLRVLQVDVEGRAARWAVHDDRGSDDWHPRRLLIVRLFGDGVRRDG